MSETWVDPRNHWTVTGTITPDGAMTEAVVGDNYGQVRFRGASFTSHDAFLAWAERWTSSSERRLTGLRRTARRRPDEGSRLR